MLGLNAKRGIEATFEKVILAAGLPPRFIKVRWGGNGAGVINDTYQGTILILPGIGDTAEINKGQFSNLVGYAIHEYGHVRYTQSSDWTDAVNAAGKDGKLLHRLINGLEDPRIEQCIITSGHCANARVLFESLLSSVLLKDYAGGDYVEPNDVGNIAFQLAVEGRRLNGYSIPCPPVYQRSKYRRAIEQALKKGNACTSTSQIIDVARELLAAIRDQQSQDDQQKDEPQDKPDDQPKKGDDSQDDGDGDGDGDGDDKGKKGKKGKKGDGGGDAEADGEKKGDSGGGSGKGSDELSIEPGESIGTVFANSIDAFAVPLITSKRLKVIITQEVS
jgi:hypothetical protein